MNVRLFERKGKAVLLTEHGKAYLSCVRDALHALKRGEEMVRHTSVPAKIILKLECLESVKHAALGMISDLCSGEDDDAFRLELSYSDAASIEQKLIRREIDLGISTAPTTGGIASRLIGYQDNVIVVPKSHAWANRKSISLTALPGHRFISYNRDCVIRGYYDSILRSLHVHPAIFAESKMHSNILDMVAYGMGVALVPRMKWLEERHDLVMLEIQDDIPPRAIYLQWAEDAASTGDTYHILQQITEHPNLSRYL